jgi:hypothetical protein
MPANIAEKTTVHTREVASSKLHLLVTACGLVTTAAAATVLIILVLQSGWALASARMAGANNDIEQAHAWSRYESTHEDTSGVTLNVSQRYTALTTFDAFSGVMVTTMAFTVGLPVLLAAALIVGGVTIRLAGEVAATSYRTRVFCNLKDPLNLGCSDTHAV